MRSVTGRPPGVSQRPHQVVVSVTTGDVLTRNDAITTTDPYPRTESERRHVGGAESRRPAVSTSWDPHSVVEDLDEPPHDDDQLHQQRHLSLHRVPRVASVRIDPRQGPVLYDDTLPSDGLQSPDQHWSSRHRRAVDAHYVALRPGRLIERGPDPRSVVSALWNVRAAQALGNLVTGCLRGRGALRILSVHTPEPVGRAASSRVSDVSAPDRALLLERVIFRQHAKAWVNRLSCWASSSPPDSLSGLRSWSCSPSSSGLFRDRRVLLGLATGPVDGSDPICRDRTTHRLRCVGRAPRVSRLVCPCRACTPVRSGLAAPAAVLRQ